MTDVSPGMAVADAAGRQCGRLDDVKLASGTGERFAIVSLGGESAERVAVPLAGARAEGDLVLLPLDAERVVTAPRVHGSAGDLPPEAAAAINAHFGLEPDATTAVMPPPPPAGDAPPPAWDADEVELVVSEEQLAVETRSVPTERVRVRKAVVTEDVTITVTVRREELVIQREPLDPAAAGAEGEALVADAPELEFVLHAEEPVVTKRIVPIERVRVRRDEIVEEQQITDTVRRERVEVDQPPITEEQSAR